MIKNWIIETNVKKFKTKNEHEMCLAITPQIRRALESTSPRWEVLNETLWKHVLNKFPEVSKYRVMWCV